MVGRLERVGLRDVWSHEAGDFTRWLRDEITVLGETIGTLGNGQAISALIAWNQFYRLGLIECHYPLKSQTA